MSRLQSKRRRTERFFRPALTPREHLINCSYHLEDDCTVSIWERIKGFIAIDHALEYILNPEAYEAKARAADVYDIGDPHWSRPSLTLETERKKNR